MKDKLARALGIIALVFMTIFLAALIATMVDYTLINNAVGFIALGTFIMTMLLLVILKADGRGFSMTKINNDIEMQKIEKERAEREAKKQAAAQDKADSASAAPEDGAPKKEEDAGV